MNPNAITRSESTLTPQQQLKEAVIAMLAIAAKMLKNPPDLTSEDVHLWTSLLQSEKVMAQDVGPALQRYMAANRYFPTPADIIGEANALARARQTEWEIQQATSRRLKREAEQMRAEEEEKARWDALTTEQQQEEIQARRAKRKEIEDKLAILNRRQMR